MSEGGKYAASMSLVGFISLLVGVFASPFFINTRGVAGLEERTDQILQSVNEMKGQMAELQHQVNSNTQQIVVGGRWTLREELDYQSSQTAEHSALRERLAILEYKAGIRSQ